MRRIIIHSHSPIPPPSFEMISISVEPIRELWVKRYRAMEKKLEKSKRDWQQFEENASPHYQKWYYSTFAEDLSRIADWNERAREQEAILRGIIAHQRLYRLDELEAYARVKERLRLKLGPYPDAADIERYESAERARAEAAQKHREALHEKRRKEAEKFWESEAEERAYLEAIEEAYDRVFRKGSAHRGNGETRENTRARPADNPETDARNKKQDDLRTLYRGIVRALHPDTGHAMTDIEKEWWNQAQESYRRSDIETLKMLSLRIQGQGKVAIDRIHHIGTLIELCTVLFEQQEQIERQKKQLKRDPIYRFWMSRSKATNRDKLTFELRAQLHTQQHRLRDFVAEVKSRLSELDRLASAHFENEDDDAEYDPQRRPRARIGTSGRGRGSGRGR